jgi:hypothetical protein
LQGASPGKQHAANPPDEVLEGPLAVVRRLSGRPQEPGLLCLAQDLPAALLLNKEQDIRWHNRLSSSLVDSF